MIRNILLNLCTALCLSMVAYGYHNISYDKNFFAQAEWLYFSPNSESRYYYTEVTTLPVFPGNYPDGTRKANRLDDYYSGYRLTLGYLPANAVLYGLVSWSDLKANHSTSVTNNAGLLPVIGLPEMLDSFFGPFASLSTHFHYWALDALLGNTFYNGACFKTDIFGGLQYAKLTSKNNFRYIDFPNSETGFQNEINGSEVEEFWGIGPLLGCQTRVALFGGISAFAEGKGAILIGQPKNISTFNFITDPITAPDASVSLNIHNERVWRCVPVLDIELGLNYDFCYRCLNGAITLGYEVLAYFDALSTLNFEDNAAHGVSFDDHRNVYLQGLTLGLSIGF